ncbi:class F sortase [Cellulomonas rhizosphaerae]|uniref:Class F sortase n=1 Tax=Cellulomonas rhizosphaerae TaxID=2293719 RepID=A0A413RIY8_9CELL|nr:class F sortase [Cellulomonas rhizosphaerae]RHA38407.1 class F sortase [Cellulomonas rhizosphaerae]
MARRHHRTGGALLGALLVGLLTACSPSTAQEPAPVVSSAPPGPTPVPTVAAVPEVPVQDATAPAADPTAPPVRLAVPSVDIDMTVIPVGVADDGSMELPPDATEVGWYRFGPAPGADEGNALLAAHVDSRLSGIGPFAQLRDVSVGARVVVTTDDGTQLRYRVASVEKIPKDQAPLDAWFGRDGAPRLVLVTCGGAWNAKIGHYADNVVVTADPIGG